MSGKELGLENTYPWLLLDEIDESSLELAAQRFFTTEGVLALLMSNPELGANSDVVIHVGLNDCAKRIFLTNERLSLRLWPQHVSDQILLFAREQRQLLLRELPSRHYVGPDDFLGNFEAIFRLLRHRSAKKIIVTTIILPPPKFWPATPGINANFSNYNSLLMGSSTRNGATLFDLDREIWATDFSNLAIDGMHLTHAGHALVANELVKLLG